MNDSPFVQHRGDLTVSTDRSRIDPDAVLGLLHTTFWGGGVSRAVLERAMANSICFGLWRGERLLGFSRVITDLTTFAYWTDVVTDAEVRGQGLGEWLGQCMLDHPDLQGLRRVSLLTRDAARLYTRLGFTPGAGDHAYMERRPS